MMKFMVVFIALFGMTNATASYMDCQCNEYVAFCKEASSDWDTAKAACEGMGGWLATMDTEQTFNGVRDAISTAGMDDKTCSDFGFWIGLHDSTHDGDGHVDGDFGWLEDMCTEYRDWAPKQPNDNTKKDPTGQNCVQMWTKKSMLYDDEYCTTVKGYVCQIPKTCTCTVV